MPDGPILVISATNRPGCNALKIAKIILSHYKSTGAPAELYSLSEMPRELFDPTSYAQKPPAWAEVQKRIVAARGLHIVTPEYNGSFPGVLKYFIDMLKFPESLEAKPVAFVGEAAGIWGGIRSVEQLIQIFGYRNAYVFPIRVFIPGVTGKLDSEGQINDSAIDERLRAQAVEFAEFTERLAK
jgi:chromate reductase, NAD(P)H dehydrogenase (quinone)